MTTPPRYDGYAEWYNANIGAPAATDSGSGTTPRLQDWRRTTVWRSLQVVASTVALVVLIGGCGAGAAPAEGGMWSPKDPGSDRGMSVLA